MNSVLSTARRGRPFLLLSVSVFALAGGMGLALAQGQPEPARPEEIVVSATGRPTPAGEIGSSVTVITAEELEARQRRTLADALMAVPGLNLVQTGGPGGIAALFMRGTEARHVKVLIDGVEAGDPSATNGAFDFGSMLTGDIARIEVLRGPQSGLYGSDAIGGVISITTRRGEGPPRATAAIEGGSHGTFSQSLGFSGGTERIDYAFNATHFRADGVQVTPRELLPPGGRLNPNSYNVYSLSGRFGIALTETLRLNLTGRYLDGTLMLTEDDFNWPSSPRPHRSQTDRSQAFARGEAVWDPFAGRFVNRFGLSYSHQRQATYTPDALGIFGAPSTYRGERLRADWRGDLELARGHMLIMGLEAQRERAETQNMTASTGNKAGLLEYQGNIAERFFLAANVRYDHHDSFGGHATYRIAPAFVVPGTQTRLKASYGTGFKAPTLSQLYEDNPAWGIVANPNLRPEQSRGWDVGFEQPLFGRRIVFGATWFHNDIDNLITTANAGGAIWTYRNVNRATTQGLETFVAFEVTPQLRLRADYTHTISRDEIAQVDLLRRPRHKASLTATWLPTDALTLSATLIYVGDFADYNRPGTALVTAPGAATMNLAVSYKANDRVTVFGRLDNLFDKRWENPSGFLQPGFGAFGGVRVALGG